jgi:hypothetical protein
MKTFVLTVSRVFPTTHKRKGEETWFIESIKHNIGLDCDIPFPTEKIHTIRANYDFWAKRIKQIQKGEAILSIRYWSGKPYHKDENGIGQVEICQLDKDSGISVQKLSFFESDIYCPYAYGLDGISNEPVYNISDIAKNDGLSLKDFKEWFKGYDLSKPMAIIHFTSFRY